MVARSMVRMGRRERSKGETDDGAGSPSGAGSGACLPVNLAFALLNVSMATMTLPSGSER